MLSASFLAVGLTVLPSTLVYSEVCSTCILECIFFLFNALSFSYAVAGYDSTLAHQLISYGLAAVAGLLNLYSLCMISGMIRRCSEAASGLRTYRCLILLGVALSTAAGTIIVVLFIDGVTTVAFYYAEVALIISLLGTQYLFLRAWRYYVNIKCSPSMPL
uniref:Uncharacterized protein n=2 Tax=Rhizochromulina marina TaxID=1034831 RepID=A0A7S2RXY1_9STRA|mmetsp:Transcript_22509/g.65442  ORF Transcript_22509/g.65442 Transcript_22509/m.65442 type:complete len:161 (+) Transcript_22509:192-674(+)